MMGFKEPRVMEKWIGHEYRNMNKSLVARQVVLSELLKKESPVARTRDGEDHYFDKISLEKLASVVPEKYHDRLKLPIFFFKNSKVPDSCYMIDDIAVDALKGSGDLNEMYRFREKKLWVGRPIAYEIANKYSTLIQFVVH
jgi:uncharacterized protein (UPF0216 family)